MSRGANKDEKNSEDGVNRDGKNSEDRAMNRLEVRKAAPLIEVNSVRRHKDRGDPLRVESFVRKEGVKAGRSGKRASFIRQQVEGFSEREESSAGSLKSEMTKTSLTDESAKMRRAACKT